jgi:hypothetical protein
LTFGKRNRFLSHRPTEPAGSSDEGPALLVDVHGHVTRVGDRAVSVSILGKPFALDDDGLTVRIEGHTYRLLSIDGRDSLVPFLIAT